MPVARNAVELGVPHHCKGADGRFILIWQWPRNVFRKGLSGMTRTGDNHYDTISAFIKSMRGVGSGRGCVLSGADAVRGRKTSSS